MTCKNPIGFETLIAYWLGEVPEKSEAKLDEHLFGCAHCTRRLEERLGQRGEPFLEKLQETNR